MTKFDFQTELQKLKNGETSAIEFGDPQNPKGYYSRVLIRYMATAGGSQFAIHLLNPRGQTGSGMYLGNNAEKVEEEALRLADDYMKPKVHANPKVQEFLNKNKDSRPELSFFAV